MSEIVTKDYIVAYVLWARNAVILQQGQVALLNSVLDHSTILQAIEAQLNSTGAGVEGSSNSSSNWREGVVCVSYSALELLNDPTTTTPQYARYNGWIDQLQPDAALLTNLSAVATILVSFSSEPASQQAQELIEEAEEILREEHS